MTPESVLADIDRLAALNSYNILDTTPEFDYDALTEIAAEICHYPVSFISLMEERRQWFKSIYGVPGLTEVPTEITVCSTTVCSNELLYVPDLTQDDRFSNLGIVAGEPHIRSYCGVPLVNSDGYTLGTLCVMHFEPTELSPTQRETIRRLSRQAMSLLELRRQLIAQEAARAEQESAKQAAEAVQEKSDSLLYNVFPPAVADELKATGKVKPRFYDMATVLFADFKDSTLLTDGMEPARLIEQLNAHFSTVDEVAAKNGVTTVRTVGDGCLCVAGAPEENTNHPFAMCLAALQIQHVIREKNKQREKLRMKPWQLRIGVNTGSVMAGIVGANRYTYDVWGTTVNTAARLEQACEPDRVQISASTYHYIKDLFEVEPRGRIEVKNLGEIDMYFLNRIKPEYSSDEHGTLPNDEFWKKT